MLTNDVDSLVCGLAAQVARKHRLFDYAYDLAQVGRTWVLAHPERVGRWLEADDNQSWRQMSAAVTGSLEQEARREKAAREGYSLEDEAYYSAELIVETLPSIFDPNRWVAPQGEQHEVRGTSDPAVSPVWPAHLADISRALDRSPMGAMSRAAIHLRFRDGLSELEIAARLALSVDEVAEYILAGIRSMVAYLGGPRPRTCDTSCQECGGVLLSRA